MNDTHQQRVGFSVGLTGGIGSGKTFVATLFAERGAAVVDTDEIAHRITAPGGEAIAAIRDQFGDEYVTAEGALDRGRMRALVFSRPEEKKRLEAIVHPLIRLEAERRASSAGKDYVIFVVPLLIESPVWRQRVSRVLVVDCPEQLQVERVMKRSGLSEQQVRAIMKTQVARETRLAAADDVIVNEGDKEALLPQVERLHALYLALVQRKSSV
jgi:dephospho-CoA kinase